MKIEALITVVASPYKNWAANETLRLAITWPMVKSQIWRSQPYCVEAKTTQIVTPSVRN